MRILLLTPQRPYPPHQGTTLRNYNLIKELARRHTVCVLTFLEPDQDPSDAGPLAELCEWVDTVPAPRRSTQTRLRQMLTTRRPDMSWRLWSPELAAQLAHRLAAGPPFDVIQIEGIEMAPYLPIINSAATQAYTIYDAHNAEWILQKRACLTDLKNPARWPAALYSWVQWQRLRHYEAETINQVAHTVAMSQPDKAALQALAPAAPITVIPNGVDLAAYANFNGQPIPNDMVFTGKMDFRPNIDAVLWFGLEVLPLIQQQRPNATFAIVGQRPHSRLEVLRSLPGVTITGYVDDVRPYIAGASVYVAPLRVGGGTRLKLMEAMAMHKPIVATQVGAEGFPVTAGKELLLADAPDTFAVRVLDLLDKPAHRTRLAQAGFVFAQTNYSWDSLVQRLETLYNQLTTQKQPTAPLT